MRPYHNVVRHCWNKGAEVAEYNLKPGEFIIMQDSSVQLIEGSERQDLDEVVLTNKNLILVMSSQEGLFRRTRYLKRYPLSTICHEHGLPQVYASKIKGDYYLQVAFGEERVVLHFSDNPRRDTERWAEGIRRAASGYLSDVKASSSNGSKPRSRASSNVTRECVGCHAPISGRHGTSVTCPYCDTRQTL